MPTIPDCIPPFDIKAPTTSGDNGAPTASLLRDANRVFSLMHDERHLVAESLYLDVTRRLNEWTSSRAGTSPLKSHQNSHHHAGLRLKGGSQKHKQAKEEQERLAKEVQQVQTLFAQKEELLSRLVNRCRLFKQAKHNLSVDDDWTYACHHFGITTFYRREPDGSLSIKLEGILNDVPLFEQICVLKEVDLHYRWAPFCSSSMTIADLDKIDTVGWFLIGMPHFGIARDGCFRAIGCDCIEEDGSIVLAAQGIQDRMPNCSSEDTYLSDDPIIQKLDIPPLSKRRGSGRMTIKKFEALITVTSPTSANTRIVANVDPNMAFIPQSLLEFVMKHLAGVLLAKLQTAARKATRNPAHNEHAKRMRAEQVFYKVWLMSKFRSLCEQKGWDMPHVAAFDFSDKDSLHFERAATFNGDTVESTVLDNMSAVTEPGPYRDGNDSVSELSTASSIWSKNPVAAYLREVEARTKRKKDEKVSASRQMAADRLKPKQIDHSKLERLDELRAAKNLRLQASPAYTPTEDDDNASFATAAEVLALSLPQMATYKLHSHSAWVRVATLFFLMTMNLLVLYSDLIPGFGRLAFGQPPSQWLVLFDAAATVAHLVVCAITDYLVCFVALMYTFSSLDLGTKAGTRIKKYYADNMARLLTGKALGIVGFALIKAWAKVVVRFVAKVCLRALSAPIPSMTIGNKFFGSLRRWQQSMEDVLCIHHRGGWFINRVADIYSGIWSLTRKLEMSVFSSLIDKVLTPLRRLRQLAQATLEPYGRPPSSSWQMEAFNTSRTLFTYSSVFLLTFLCLFSLIAMRSRSEKLEQRQHADTPRVKQLVSKVSDLSTEREDGDTIVPSLASSAPLSPRRRGIKRRMFARRGKRMVSTPVLAPAREDSGAILAHTSM